MLQLYAVLKLKPQIQVRTDDSAADHYVGNSTWYRCASSTIFKRSDGESIDCKTRLTHPPTNQYSVAVSGDVNTCAWLQRNSGFSGMLICIFTVYHWAYRSESVDGEQVRFIRWDDNVSGVVYGRLGDNCDILVTCAWQNKIIIESTTCWRHVR